MREVTDAFDNHSWEKFWDRYRSAVDEVDCHYLKIREARKKLYDHGLRSTPREINIKPNLCDKKINWDISESKMRIIDYRAFMCIQEIQRSDQTSND